MYRLTSAFVIAMFCVTGSAAYAQETGAKEEAKKAGSATKEAAKHAGKATVKGTKKAAKATKDAVQRTFVCVDGATDEATLKVNACKNHGGVRDDAKAK